MKQQNPFHRNSPNEVKIGLVSISDRASQGVYVDEGIPSLKNWLGRVITTPTVFHERLIPDETEHITSTLIELVDELGCDLVFTTGGTGPSRRDLTPEATLEIGTREMRQISLRFVPTAILSRQVAVLREIENHAALIMNLPGQPKSIQETLEGLKDAEGKVLAHGIFAAVPYCIDLIGGPLIETDETIVKAFRPKKKK